MKMVTNRVTLKNIKHNMAMSEETNCFSATVYIDGKKAGKVCNRGNGGENEYWPLSLRDTLNEIAKPLPKWKSSYDPDKEYDHDADSVIDTLLDDAHENQQLKRLCAKKILVRLPNKKYEEGAWDVFSVPYTAEGAKKIRSLHGEATEIANERFLG